MILSCIVDLWVQYGSTWPVRLVGWWFVRWVVEQTRETQPGACLPRLPRLLACWRWAGEFEVEQGAVRGYATPGLFKLVSPP